MNKSNIWAAITGFIAGALGYWFNEYNDWHAFGISIFWILGLLPFISAAGIVWILNIRKPLRVAVYTLIGVLTACLGRVIFDTTFIDSTSHNLWPFEFFAVSSVSFPAALFGTYMTFVIKRLKNSEKYDTQEK